MLLQISLFQIIEVEMHTYVNELGSFVFVMGCHMRGNTPSTESILTYRKLDQH